MVRVNIIEPWRLADQHLVAEYLEIMMLASYARSSPRTDDVPESYRLGKGHIKFFKNKLGYLKKRHELIKLEMEKRGFVARKNLDIGRNKKLFGDWKPNERDFSLIKSRIIEKISKKPEWYRYYGSKRDLEFFNNLLKTKTFTQ